MGGQFHFTGGRRRPRGEAPGREWFLGGEKGRRPGGFPSGSRGGSCRPGVSFKPAPEIPKEKGRLDATPRKEDPGWKGKLPEITGAGRREDARAPKGAAGFLHQGGRLAGVVTRSGL